MTVCVCVSSIEDNTSPFSIAGQKGTFTVVIPAEYFSAELNLNRWHSSEFTLYLNIFRMLGVICFTQVFFSSPIFAGIVDFHQLGAIPDDVSGHLVFKVMTMMLVIMMTTMFFFFRPSSLA